MSLTIYHNSTSVCSAKVHLALQETCKQRPAFGGGVATSHSRLSLPLFRPTFGARSTGTSQGRASWFHVSRVGQCEATL